jgi:cytochrome c biogenesis protein CcdA
VPAVPVGGTVVMSRSLGGLAPCMKGSVRWVCSPELERQDEEPYGFDRVFALARASTGRLSGTATFIDPGTIQRYTSADPRLTVRTSSTLTGGGGSGDAMSDIGYLAAFFGGVLALISPCSALLLPSFFAYAFQRTSQLLGRTALFYVGLVLTLVPLGAGSSTAAALFYGHRESLILVAGWLIVAFGVVQILGGGFALGPAVRLQQRMVGRGGAVSVIGLGAAYGLAGFCSGPILGAVLTVAAAGGRPLRGGALLAVYAFGMAAPMFVLALLWDRFRLGHRRWLRGISFRVGLFHLHTTMLASGLLFVGVGALFLAYDGTAGITGVLGLGDTTSAETAAQRWVSDLRIPDWLVLLVVAALTLAVAARRWRRAGVQAVQKPGVSHSGSEGDGDDG